uniref:Uncharacterized protein n=1 Tax=Haptolina brevifila TaxID=156173 RepID=A0A7S2DJK1_9EUKA
MHASRNPSTPHTAWATWAGGGRGDGALGQATLAVALQNSLSTWRRRAARTRRAATPARRAACQRRHGDAAHLIHALLYLAHRPCDRFMQPPDLSDGVLGPGVEHANFFIHIREASFQLLGFFGKANRSPKSVTNPCTTCHYS